jgi:translation initiation factor 2B subunit (eIF-2B alpha/beta/delta family)
VLADGSLLNTPGTAAPAHALRLRGAGVLALAELAKWTREEPPPQVPQHRRWSPLYDLTPSEDVTAVVCERGPLSPAEYRAAAEQFH